MNYTDFEVQSREVDEFLNEIGDEEKTRQILLDGLKAGAMVLRDRTRESFRSKLGEGASHSSPYLGGKPFYEGVRMIVDKSYNEAIVSIMKDYRMRFYENGTKDRVTKKGYKRGRITAKHFFQEARSSSESEIYDAISNGIDIAMRKYLL